MALINCTECGHQISDQAKACTQCGHPNQDNDSLYVSNPMKGKLTIIIGVILVMISILSFLVNFNKSTNPVVISLTVTFGIMGLVLIAAGKIHNWFYWG
jgi:nicotinamide riboside transporter PnuC